MAAARLGERLADGGYSPRHQIQLICETLKSAWRRLDESSGLTTGAEKARQQRDFIQSAWAALGKPCSIRLMDRAVAYTVEREAAFDPKSSDLVHGDAHIWNALEVPNASSPELSIYKFVDPDGLFAEPALDLAISLRD